jgi:hypothetical protein
MRSEWRTGGLLADQAGGGDDDARDEGRYAAIQQYFIKDLGHDFYSSTP